MSNITQGEAVFQAVNEVFDVRPVPPTSSWTEDQKQKVYGYVLAMFKAGTTTHKGSPTDAELVKYIPGLVNNWVRKDKRLNGGSTYQPKRPGSRTGSGDATLTALKQLQAVSVDPTVKAEIELEIEKRMAELKAAKAPAIDITKLPEHLRHLVQK